jgi:hypothetical protein
MWNDRIGFCNETAAVFRFFSLRLGSGRGGCRPAVDTVLISFRSVTPAGEPSARSSMAPVWCAGVILHV